MNYNYTPGFIHMQGRNTAYYTLSAGVSYNMLQDKLSLQLNFRDLIFPDNSFTETFGDYFASRSYSNWRRRQFSFNASYRINNYQQKMERREENFEGGGSSSGGSNV
jgi:hypothetical protein